MLNNYLDVLATARLKMLSKKENSSWNDQKMHLKYLNAHTIDYNLI